MIKSEYAPLDQLLLTKQDTNTVRNWIGDWARRNKKHPRETVTDCSLVLLNALCLEFNHCSYKEYQVKCLDFLLSDGQMDPGLKTFIRLDRAHLINSICRWNIWKTVETAKKDFYTRIFAYALTINNFDDMKLLIEASFVICESQSFKQNSYNHYMMKWLMKQFAGQEEHDTSTSSVNAEDSSLDNSIEDIKKYLHSNGMLNFIHSLQKTAEQHVNENDSISVIANYFYLPQVKKNGSFIHAVSIV